MYKCILVCVSLFVCGSLGGHAPFITPCTQTDFDCMLSSAKAALPHLINGVKDLDMPPLDPLHAKDITVNAGNGDLAITFKNVIVHGLGKCTINKVERDAVKSTGFLDINCPLTVVGDYKAKGKLFLLDLWGEGLFSIKGDNIHGNITMKMKDMVRDGVKYLKITGFDFQYEPVSRFYFEFKNLFGGDKEKAGPVEQVLNDGWKDVMTDPNIGKPIMTEALLQLVAIANKLFHNVPADELQIVN